MFNGFLPKDKDERMQYIITLIISAFLAVFTFEGFWVAAKTRMYLLGGLLGAAIILYFVFYKKIYLEFDTFLFASFFLLCWISGIIAFGVSASFFLSQFFCAWIAFLALFYAAGSVKNYEKMFAVCAFVFSLAELVVCIFVLFMATRTIFTERVALSSVLGLVRNGRLCAFGNANRFGFACTAFLMVSVFGLLLSKGFLRIYYSVCIFVGWFCLGLTGCRTGAIGFSASLGILIFSSGIKKYCIGRKDHLIIRYAAVFAITGIATVLAIETFVLPSKIYHGLVGLIGGEEFLMRTRSIHDRNGTITDRSYIWVATLKSLVRNPRRLLLGISSLSKEEIERVYIGHHENSAPHSHNAFLEITRVHGILALFVWLILLVRWADRCIRGLFNYELKPAFRYMAACAAGIMIMGLTEPVPFLYKSSWPLTMTFFVICGFFAGLKRSDK
ncbi:O-antigen ligase family protein [Butyrivibrio sp. MC2021]|uniref:O-antigen ligase family protein n=1 Tax=Butyrivibrio sp. MC2021 TaxID=1408306 RepID=UPI00047EA682|nr:O-antigen ligase family protein [Butyrivibrio sp. MC2021]